MDEPVSAISLGQASHLLNVSRQALSETREPLQPADVLSLMQILARTAEVPAAVNESRPAAEQLSQHFITVADNIISSDNARMWNVVKEVNIQSLLK